MSVAFSSSYARWPPPRARTVSHARPYASRPTLISSCWLQELGLSGSCFAVGVGCAISLSGPKESGGSRRRRQRRRTALAFKPDLLGSSELPPSQDQFHPGERDDADATDQKVAPGAARAAAVGDVTDPQVREQAFEYLAARRHLKDELLATETEFERLAVVMCDPGAAMELNDKRVELEEELENMRAREQELAELMVEIGQIHAKVNERGRSLEQLNADLSHAQDENAAAQQELRQKEEAISANRAMLEELGEARSVVDASIEEAVRAVAESLEEQVLAKRRIEESKAIAAEKQDIADARSKELSEFLLELRETEQISQELVAKAESSSVELSRVKSKKLSLEAAILDSQRQCEALKGEMSTLEESLKDLPSELEAAQQELAVLSRESSQRRAILSTEEAELQQRREECSALRSEVEQLKSQRAELASQANADAAAVENLSSEKSALEAEILKLAELARETGDEQEQLRVALPGLLSKRDDLQNKVDSLVSESKSMRAELKTGARDVSKSWRKAKAEVDLAKEQRLFRDSTKELLQTAQAVTDSQKQAQAAFESALEQRKKAEVGFAELKALMEQRAQHMHAQEAMMLKSLEEDQRASEHLNNIAGDAKKQLGELDELLQATRTFEKQAEEYSDRDGVDKAAAAAAQILGALGNLLKASRPTPK